MELPRLEEFEYDKPPLEDQCFILATDILSDFDHQLVQETTAIGNQKIYQEYPVSNRMDAEISPQATVLTSIRLASIPMLSRSKELIDNTTIALQTGKYYFTETTQQQYADGELVITDSDFAWNNTVLFASYTSPDNSLPEFSIISAEDGTDLSELESMHVYALLEALRDSNADNAFEDRNEMISDMTFTTPVKAFARSVGKPVITLLSSNDETITGPKPNYEVIFPDDQKPFDASNN